MKLDYIKETDKYYMHGEIINNEETIDIYLNIIKANVIVHKTEIDYFKKVIDQGACKVIDLKTKKTIKVIKRNVDIEDFKIWKNKQEKKIDNKFNVLDNKKVIS